MSDPIHGGVPEKLGAYLDGELDRRAQSAVQAHLETCPTCRAELEELRGLSAQLRAAPLPDFTPALDFKAQFMLQLPRRPEPQPERAASGLLPWLAPALVLGGWIFIQVTLGLSGLVTLAHQTGFLDGAAAWAAADPQQMLWVSAARAMLGGGLSPESQTGLQVLNDAGLLAQNVAVALLWQVGAALLYWGAFSLVWRHKVVSWWNSLTAE